MTKEDWVRRQAQWRIFADWEAAHPAPSRDFEQVIADLGAICEWLPEDVRQHDPDPEKEGIQRMRRCFSLLGQGE
jgi:hypothetical protein